MESLDRKGADYVRERMPMVGLGTYQISSEQTIFRVVNAALEAGYRSIDTAQIYRNEQHIGKALKELLPKYGLKREDIFITTKVSPANQGAENCVKSLEESLKHLGTDYVDLALIHWPGTSKLKRDDPRNAEKRAESWRAMEQMHRTNGKKGPKLRAIGVSNYEVVHLEELLGAAGTRVLPAVNQCECHPHWFQPELVDYCASKGIHFQAYSSFGSASNRDELFRDQQIQTMAAKYNCSVTDFLLGWAVSQGMSVLPRSSNPEHVRTNFVGAKVRINGEDIERVRAEKKHKYCWDPDGIR